MATLPSPTRRGVAVVFGGSGFLGRYVVKRLAASGYVVRVAVPDPEGALFLKPMGGVGQVVPLYASLAKEATVARALAGADIVVNLVGILAETRAGDFQLLQAEGPALIGRLADPSARLVHVSAIGADPSSPSRYAKTKGDGEAALLAAFPRATILRPSLVFGAEDKLFNRFAGMAQLSPVMPVIAGQTRFQPVYVGDVADAVMQASHRPDAPGRIFELGGPAIWTMRQILAFILAETRRDRRLIDVPMGLAQLQAAVLERLPGKLLTQDQLLLLQRDNVVTEGMPGLADLGVAATPVEMVVPGYLARYRPGGGRREPIPAM